MWRALCAVAALAVARAEVYDEDDAAAAPVATNLGSALEFLGDGPTGGATGADGGAAAVRDATGTIEALEGVVGTGGTGAATGGAPSATGGTEVERKIPRLFPEVAFPPESDAVPAVNGSAFCGRAETCIDCTAMVGCGFDSDALRCTPGTSEGPLHSVSTDPEQIKFHLENYWQYGSCSDVSCDEYPTCTQCMADSLCGWCAATGVCRYVQHCSLCVGAFV